MLKSIPAGKKQKKIMHKVVIDTNIAVSALLSPSGHSAHIIDRIFQNDLTPYFSSAILDEYTSILARSKFGFATSDQLHFIEGIKKYGLACIPTPSAVSFSDESDRVFYEVAKAADAYLITGNIKHFPSEPWIVLPSKYVGLFPTLRNISIP